jgi:Rrf2 family protein
MLTNRAKYALKALLYLARKRGTGPIQASTIAEAESIPHKFLEAILIQLRNKGIIRSKVGKGGGHELVQDPDSIDVLTVIRAIDGPVAPLPCLSHTAYHRCDDCENESSCGVRQMLAKAHELQVRQLTKMTLADGLADDGDAGARTKGRPAKA